MISGSLPPAAAIPAGLALVLSLPGVTGTGGGDLQTFAVPDGATRVLFGVLDAYSSASSPAAYGDNTGSFEVTLIVE